jgi:hypothetical protein
MCHLNFTTEGMTRVLLQLWLMGENPAVSYPSCAQELLGSFMFASTLRDHLPYWSQTNGLNQPEIVVFLVWNGGETGHRTSSLLPGNPTETGSPTDTTTTSHWIFMTEIWFTISALHPILEVHSTLVLMVGYTSSSISQSS